MVESYTVERLVRREQGMGDYLIKIIGVNHRTGLPTHVTMNWSWEVFLETNWDTFVPQYVDSPQGRQTNDDWALSWTD